jgi:hypothetical protein
LRTGSLSSAGPISVRRSQPDEENVLPERGPEASGYPSIAFQIRFSI